MSRRKTDVSIARYEDIYNDNAGLEEQKIVHIPLGQLHTFANHPFRVENDDKMQETVESIRQYGVLEPGIVRPLIDGGYEIIAGHRRKLGSELAGKKDMPVIVRSLSDDEASVIMVDSNIQREDILPSEKAKAYKIKYNALKHQGKKASASTAGMVGEKAGDSARTVQRYVRIASLCDGLLDALDKGRITIHVAELLTCLDEKEQSWFCEVVENTEQYPSKEQALKIKEEKESGSLTQNIMYAIMVRQKKKAASVTIKEKELVQYFPDEYTDLQMKEVILSLLEDWSTRQEECI